MLPGIWKENSALKRNSKPCSVLQEILFGLYICRGGVSQNCSSRISDFPLVFPYCHLHISMQALSRCLLSVLAISEPHTPCTKGYLPMQGLDSIYKAEHPQARLCSTWFQENKVQLWISDTICRSGVLHHL